MHPNDGRVVSNLMVQGFERSGITIYCDGPQTRSFCYVDDLIDGPLAIMAMEDSVIGPINLRHSIELSVVELDSKII